MNTIKELQDRVCDGENAQECLNDIARDIYDKYTEGLQSEIDEIKTEFPDYEPYRGEITDLFGHSFHSYWFSKSKFILQGYDSFRGETNYETDSLPIEVFNDDPAIRESIIQATIKEKMDTIRLHLKQKAKEEEEIAKRQYEQLKERFENEHVHTNSK